MTYLSRLGLVYLGMMIGLAAHRVGARWMLRWSKECAAHGIVGVVHILIDVVQHFMHLLH